MHYLNFFILILPLSLRDRSIKAECPLAPSRDTRKWELLLLSFQRKQRKKLMLGSTGLQCNVGAQLVGASSAADSNLNAQSPH